MTSTIKVNTITTESGSTLTVGGCGKTVALASGASQTGFGRTGTVNWNTTKITADPGPAVSGVGYFTDTGASAFNVTLPSSPSANDIVAVADYAENWHNNNLTILRNGSNIEGDASDFVCNTKGASITFVYVDATKGWIAVNSGNSNQAFGDVFIAATGGTVTCCGNCKIHTFTGPGTFAVSRASTCTDANIFSHVVIAGGGGGGNKRAGGGGAGGYREVKSPATPFTASPLDGYPSSPNRVTASVTSYPITVGAGGTGGAASGSACNVTTASTSGSASTFSTVTSAGGGTGGGLSPNAGPNGSGKPGGSGGGGFAGGPPSTPFPAATAGGTGNDPSTSPAQGNDGGVSRTSPDPTGQSGGGGGAGEAGKAGNDPGGLDGRGGAGVTSCITGSPVQRGGGGGGGSRTPGVAAPGGAGGGGNGVPNGSGTAGTANTGGGGGGMSDDNCVSSGNGGSGVVIIRYKFQ
jgi:hypothetical protein